MKKTGLIFLLAIFACNVFGQKSVSSNLLTAWMDLHCKMVRMAKEIPHVAYSRHFSYTAIAVYESIVGSDSSYRSLAGQLNDLDRLPSPNGTIFWCGSLNAAYATMLRNFYGPFEGCTAAIDSMESAQHREFLQQGISGAQLDKSSAYGKEVATAVIVWAGEDRSNTDKQYTSLTGEGVWTPATKAAAPFWSENRPLTKGLPPFSWKQPVYSKDTGSIFYRMAKEVYTTTSNLTPEQKTIALFWDDSPDGKYMTVYGHWTAILSALVKEHGLALLKGAEAYVRMTIAMHDASILAWKGKYQFHVVRPITYIQQYIDGHWKPLITTPPHPEFPAAHATLSNAAAVALSSLFGEACAIADGSYTDIGMKQRHYPSLREAAREAGMSRLYGGIHYRYSIEQGFLAGAAVAKHINEAVSFH
ncbi:MAG TPA: vanadium-dependent haloperoxidase [Flavisolibacter sp.]|nr:vanadium-dependent haloperoxidase [Flavisolibacter sp.]